MEQFRFMTNGLVTGAISGAIFDADICNFKFAEYLLLNPYESMTSLMSLVSITLISEPMESLWNL